MCVCVCVCVCVRARVRVRACGFECCRSQAGVIACGGGGAPAHRWQALLALHLSPPPHLPPPLLPRPSAPPPLQTPGAPVRHRPRPPPLRRTAGGLCQPARRSTSPVPTPRGVLVRATTCMYACGDEGASAAACAKICRQYADKQHLDPTRVETSVGQQAHHVPLGLLAAVSCHESSCDMCYSCGGG